MSLRDMLGGPAPAKPTLLEGTRLQPNLTWRGCLGYGPAPLVTLRGRVGSAMPSHDSALYAAAQRGRARGFSTRGACPLANLRGRVGSAMPSHDSALQMAAQHGRAGGLSTRGACPPCDLTRGWRFRPSRRPGGGAGRG